MAMTTFVDDYDETRKRIVLEQAMTRQAELILSMLGANLPVLIRPHVVLKKADTASTDAKRYINMPSDYNGISTMELEFAWARTALLAHELSHWLQPCDEIEQVEKDTGLSHDFANVVMDIQGEALIASLLPYYNDHLTKLRRHTGRNNRKDYEASAKKSVKADNFFGTIMSLAMLGRFVLYPDFSFYRDFLTTSVRQLHGKLYPYGKNHKDASRVDSLLLRMNKARDIAAIDLPEFLREIAKDYPELCTQEKAPFPIPQDGHGGTPIPSGLLDEFKKHKPRRPQISFWEGDALGHRPTTSEESKRANAMQLHFNTPKGGQKIMAPGEFDRMAALAGSPMPWTMTIKDDAGKTAMSDVLVAVDISGSMRGSFDGKDVNNEKWDTAISAARSITLAVKSAGGDVRGLIFDDQVWYAKGYESKVFFAASVAGLSLLKPNNMTSFEWLPYLWQKFPDHRVVIITDGGEPDDLSGIHHTPERQKARTSAIVIPWGNAENMKRIAANVIEVRSLDLLAGAMTSVLPRRTM
jgi:hypothetical protein